jgi:hypothetical protein
MSNGIIQPNKVTVETTYADGPLAQPTVITLPVPGQIKVLIRGGLTKVEHMAGEIAGHIFSMASLAAPDSPLLPPDVVASLAVDYAEAILTEVTNRNKERQNVEGNDTPEIEPQQ